MTIVNSTLEFLLIFLATVAACVLLACLLCALADAISGWRDKRHERRIAAAEAELDCVEQQLRQAVLDLADELARDRETTSKAMTRATFLTTGQVPTRR
ncbi:MAG: hypothetical protein EPN48_15545 [Microbacteriaceae bacterium]|nr:MAG: hypothetical protein EPN48_15545 [Microbacteriaceae bacterium]